MDLSGGNKAVDRDSPTQGLAKTPEGPPSPADVDSLRENLRNVPDPVGFLANLFAGSPIAIGLCRADGTSFLTNKAFRNLFGGEPPPGYNILKDDIAMELGLMPYIRRAFAGETVQMPPFWYDPRDLKSVKVTEGRRVAIAMTMFPLFDRHGKPEFIAATYKDETEVSLARERLEQANATLEARVEERTKDLAAANHEMGVFAASVSHDLRSPLRAISGLSGLLLHDHAEVMDAEAKNHLNRIVKTVKRMDRLIEGILAFSQLGRRPLDVQEVSIAEVVRQALEDLEDDRVKSPAELVVGDLPPHQADPVLLKQVFVNLIGNAFKFTRKREDARIEVGSREENGKRLWFVRDNGAGFDMKDSAKLFGMFERLHKQEDYEGTGVGLALVRRIIEKHGGRIWAEAAPGQGALFSFTLES
jgi:signal transduction histidine kinase